MTRVLVLVAPGEAPLPGLDDLPTTVELRTVSRESDLLAYLPQTDVLVVTDFRTDLLERCWPHEHRIRWVHATSAGVDALMFPALWDSDVQLTNARGVFDLGIAEYVLGAVLMHAKDSLGNLALQRQQRWQHRETRLAARQRALVIGAGSIGSEVARLLSALNIEVTGIARTARQAPHFNRVLASDQLDAVLPEADVVIITAPLTEDTRGLINRDRLALMRREALLVNVGRGAIVVTDDLVAALQQRQIGAAVLDVVDPEPLPRGHALWNMPNVVLSAHMAGDFIGWRQALGEQFLANLQRWLAGEPLLNRVGRGK